MAYTKVRGKQFFGEKKCGLNSVVWIDKHPQPDPLPIYQ